MLRNIHTNWVFYIPIEKGIETGQIIELNREYFSNGAQILKIQSSMNIEISKREIISLNYI